MFSTSVPRARVGRTRTFYRAAGVTSARNAGCRVRRQVRARTAAGRSGVCRQCRLSRRGRTPAPKGPKGARGRKMLRAAAPRHGVSPRRLELQSGTERCVAAQLRGGARGDGGPEHRSSASTMRLRCSIFSNAPALTRMDAGGEPMRVPRRGTPSGFAVGVPRAGCPSGVPVRGAGTGCRYGVPVRGAGVARRAVPFDGVECRQLQGLPDAPLNAC